MSSKREIIEILSNKELKELFHKYMDFLKLKNFSPATISAYYDRIIYFFSFLTENRIKTIDEITPQLMQKYVIYCYRLRTWRNEPFKKSSLNCLVQTVKKFFGHLYKMEVIGRNPAEKLVPPKYNYFSGYGKVLTEEEMKKLLQQPQTQNPFGLRDRSILEMLYSTGMRINELNLLNISDIEKDTVKVHGKGNKERILPIGKTALKYLKDYLKIREVLVKDKNEPALYVNKYGERLSKLMVQKLLQEYGRLAKLQKAVMQL